MKRYLDPKNDLTFKRIFGEHPHLLISFLNALLPLTPDRLIKSIEYLSPEQVPENPMGKNSIVDVKCYDNYKRHFIVEMQMYWSDVFKKRLVFNASKAYVRQIRKSESYHLLQPVYGLGIVNDTFDHTTEEFYHHYQTINRYNTEEVIDGLEFVLVELEKFKPSKWVDRKMAVLWLRFLSEIEDATQNVSVDLLGNTEIEEALSLCEEGAFTPEELELYDRYWDYVRTEKGIADVARVEGLVEGKAEGEAIGLAKGKIEGLAKGKVEGLAKGLAKGKAEGEAIGLAKGLAEGEAIGREKELERTVLTAYQNKFSIEQIHAFSNRSKEDIFEILKRNKIALV
jgi:predicted transposase/invertase (TIGR01784 family)